MSPASDEDLLARQSALQDEARQVLAELDLATLVADVGPLLVTGSFVSGLTVTAARRSGRSGAPGDIQR